jgi:protease I
MSDLHQLRVAILATDGVEEIELYFARQGSQRRRRPRRYYFRSSRWNPGFEHHNKKGTIHVDRTLDEASPTGYDVLVLPGGALNADQLRVLPKIREFIYEMDRAGQPIAVICHAPWELVSAGVVLGRTLISWPTIQDDVANAGGRWEDREVVVDGNLVTSRGPKDLPAFNREMLARFSRIPAGSHR